MYGNVFLLVSCIRYVLYLFDNDRFVILIRFSLFSGFETQIFSQVETGEDSQELNRCTECDEKRCGIDFVVCAGANRRRTGILSDIERNAELEVCRSVEEPWWRNETVQRAWRGA